MGLTQPISDFRPPPLTEDSAIRYLEQIGYVVIKACQSSYLSYQCDLPAGHDIQHHSKGKAAEVWWAR